MKNLAQAARINRIAALEGLSQRRAARVLTVDFATRTRIQAEPVLNFSARRQQISAAAPAPVTAPVAVPVAAHARPAAAPAPLLLVSDSRRQLAA